MNSGRIVRHALFAVRVALGGVFVLAGILKVAEWPAFAQSIVTLDLLPDTLEPSVSAGLPILEILCGALLIAGRETRVVASVVAVLMLVFLSVQGILHLRGGSADCGCFGAGDETSPVRALARNLVLLLCAAVLVRRSIPPAGREIRTRRLCMTSATAIAVGVGLRVIDVAREDARPIGLAPAATAVSTVAAAASDQTVRFTAEDPLVRLLQEAFGSEGSARGATPADVVARALDASEMLRALRVLSSFPVGPGRDRLREELLRRALDADPAGTAKWLVGQPPEAWLLSAAKKTFRRWSTIAPDPAAALAMTLPDAGMRAEVLEIIAAEWAHHHPEAVVAWGRKAESERDRTAILKSVVAYLGQTDPVATGGLLAAMQPSDTICELADRMAERWAYDDLSGAAAWVAALAEDSALQRPMSARVKEIWGMQDPAAAEAWSQALPMYSKIEHTIADGFRRAGGACGPSLITWAARLGDEWQHRFALERIFTHWAELQPVEADAWLGASALPDIRKQRLRQVWSSRHVPR